MKFLKHTGFLEPYTIVVQHIVPLHKLSKIKAYRVQLQNTIRVDGLCTHLGNGKYNIALRLWDHNEISTRQIRTDIAYVLDSYAHELAHLSRWEHTPKHMILQARIMKKFGQVARDLGIKDTYKPWR